MLSILVKFFRIWICQLSSSDRRVWLFVRPSLMPRTLWPKFALHREVSLGSFFSCTRTYHLAVDQISVWSNWIKIKHLPNLFQRLGAADTTPESTWLSWSWKLGRRSSYRRSQRLHPWTSSWFVWATILIIWYQLVFLTRSLHEPWLRRWDASV